VAEAASEDGRNGAALVLVGRSWIALADLLQAQKALLRAARVSPNEPGPYRWLGEVLLKRGDPERAAKVLSKAQVLAPGDATIHHCEVIHHSDPNRTDQPRLGLLFVYRGDHTETDPKLKAAYTEAVTATPPA